MRLIWVKRETEYFLRGDWTAQITLIALAFSALWRTPMRSIGGLEMGVWESLVLRIQHARIELSKWSTKGPSKTERDHPI